MTDYMRIRPSTQEFCYGLEAFKRLSVPDLCRRFGWDGDGEWLDQERDAQAEKEVSALDPQTV